MMRLARAIAAITTVIGMAAIPAIAMPQAQPTHPGRSHKGMTGSHGPTGSKGPSGATGPAAGAKAYGYYCQNESKKHVTGREGTPFSQCVTAMAKLKSGKTDSPKAACASLSKAHTAGEQGTPFSRCVSDGAKLLRDQHHK
jgi:hypothetical protein